jgi:hypothetical protein
MSEYSSDDGELVQNLQKVVITHLKKRGTRDQVWAGEAHSTSGGLTRNDLIISNTCKIVSKKASEKSKQLMLDRHAKKDVDEKPAPSKSKTSKKVEEQVVEKPAKKSTVKTTKKPSKKKQVSASDGSESDQ